MRALHGRLFYPSNQETCICLQDKAPYVKKGRAWLKLFGYTGEARLSIGIAVKGPCTLVNQPDYSQHAMIWLLHLFSRPDPGSIETACTHSAISVFI